MVTGWSKENLINVVVESIINTVPLEENVGNLGSSGNVEGGNGEGNQSPGSLDNLDGLRQGSSKDLL